MKRRTPRKTKKSLHVKAEEPASEETPEKYLTPELNLYMNRQNNFHCPSCDEDQATSKEPEEENVKQFTTFKFDPLASQ
jgi:hypothetical protein